MMLDELVDLDEERLTALELLKRNKRRWKVIMLMDQMDKTLGKWSPKWEGPLQVILVFFNGAYEIEEFNEEKRILKVNGKYLKKIQACTSRNQNIARIILTK